MNTAVEWLIEQMEVNNYISKESIRLSYWLVNEAKAMEKEQIKDAWDVGKDSFSSMSAEQYYNKTFKTDKG